MKNMNKIHIILAVTFLIITLFSSTVLYTVGSINGRKNGHKNGYALGIKKGKQLTYEMGFDSNFENGVEQGKREGIVWGEEFGRRIGRKTGQIERRLAIEFPNLSKAEIDKKMDTREVFFEIHNNK